MNNFKRVVIAVDNSASSATLAQIAFKLAKQLKAEVAVASVIDTRTLMGAEGLSTGEAIVLESNSVAENLNILIKNVFGNYPVSRYIVEGTPGEKILQLAKDWSADMIIVGTHGRKGLSRFFLGSVAEEILRNSHVPVTIIPINHG